MRRLLITFMVLTLSIGSIFLLPAGSCSTAAIGRAFSAPECRAESFAAPVLADTNLDGTLPGTVIAIVTVAVAAFIASKRRAEAQLPVSIQAWFRLVHPTLPRGTRFRVILSPPRAGEGSRGGASALGLRMTHGLSPVPCLLSL